MTIDRKLVLLQSLSLTLLILLVFQFPCLPAPIHFTYAGLRGWRVVATLTYGVPLDVVESYVILCAALRYERQGSGETAGPMYGGNAHMPDKIMSDRC